MPMYQFHCVRDVESEMMEMAEMKTEMKTP
jgi:hypothetical protein